MLFDVRVGVWGGIGGVDLHRFFVVGMEGFVLIFVSTFRYVSSWRTDWGCSVGVEKGCLEVGLFRFRVNVIALFSLNLLVSIGFPFNACWSRFLSFDDIAHPAFGVLLVPLGRVIAGEDETTTDPRCNVCFISL